MIALAALAGCNQQAVEPGHLAGVALEGSIHGGQQPVAGSTVQLYAAASTGTGAASTALLSQTVTTSDGSGLANANANAGNANNTLPVGYFTLTGAYTCPSAESQVYLTASGGNPGLAAGTNNTALQMMLALGSCGQLNASTRVQINEATTVGSVAALFPYMTAANAVGSVSGAAPALAESFSVASEYMNPATGTAPGASLPAGYYASSTEINTLADVLASCMNSAGNTSTSSTCAMLFQAATPPNGTAPTNTVGALLNILNNPTQNVSAIFTLSSSIAPFAPELATAPSDWTLPILAIPAVPSFTPKAGSYAGSQSVTIASPTAGTTVYYTTDGSTPTTRSNAYTGPITVSSSSTLKAIAVNRVQGSVGTAAYTVTGTPAAPVFSLPTGTYAGPQVLTLSSTSGDAVIYFTVDGSTPTSSSRLYSGGIQVSSSETVRGVAIAAGASSATTSATYSFNNASGTIYTYAGGTTSGDGIAAIQARIATTNGITVDAAGNIFFADTGNQRIRKITASTGIISTVAGTGTSGFSGDGADATLASLASPYSTAVDGSGNLYIADTSNNRIRMVSASTGNISTVAGGGTSASLGDGGPATSAYLSQPHAVAVDGSGNLYIADSSNYRIRLVSASTGLISTLAGTGTYGYSGDGGQATAATLRSAYGIVLDGSGNVYFTDYYGFVVRKISATTGVISTVAGTGTSGTAGDGGLATAATLNYPHNAVVDPAGNLYISDASNNRIRKVSATTGVISTVAGTGTSGFSGDSGPATSATLKTPGGVALDPSGNLYITDTVNYRIRMVTASTGIITTIAGTGTTGYAPLTSGTPAISSSLYSPLNAALDASGNLYIADTTNYRIRRVDASSGVATTVAGIGTSGFSGDGGAATAAALASPAGVVVDASGNLYIADTANYRIRRIDASTGNISTIAGTGTAGAGADNIAATSSNLYTPRGMVIDSAGNLLFADSGSNRIRKITLSTGIITTVAGTGTSGSTGDGGAATSALLATPWYIALDSSNNLFIADASNNRIRMVTASSGIITTVAGIGTYGYLGDGGPATAARLYSPRGVAVDSAGNLYIADTSNNVVRMVSASTGIINTIAGTGSAGFSGDGGAATAAKLSIPVGVILGPNGSLFIVDQGNYRIRVVYP